MMWALFGKECKKIGKSLVYYIYLAAFVLFITGQMNDVEWLDRLAPPQPGQESYGYGYSEDPGDIMEEGLETLYQELLRNQFATYPFGFYKGVTLKQEELAELTAAFVECTGMDMRQLQENVIAYYEGQEGNPDGHEVIYGWHIPMKEGLSYAEFEQLMAKAADLVGPGSSYEKSSYEKAGMAPLDYEDALENYTDLCEKDKATGAQMRLFCDYAGVFLAAMPVFVGVAMCLQDKRAKAREVICARPVSSAVLVMSRYLAAVVMLFVPIVLYALLMQMPCAYAAEQMGISADWLAFLKYTVLWLLPLIMVMLGATFLITEAAENILAIPILVVWAYGSMLSARTLTGDFGWKLVTRWNRLGGYGQYASELGQLYRNRALYAALGILCAVLAALVYEKKRREGGSMHGKIRKNNG